MNQTPERVRLKWLIIKANLWQEFHEPLPKYKIILNFHRSQFDV